jgi:ATP-dependent helicase HrpB
MVRLPIDALLSDIATTLRLSIAIVIEAPPGAGKTTRVPRALLDAGFSEHGEIVVLQPRRLSARLGAARVAEELGETPGGIVGYTVRFEDVSGPRTRIRFVTEGILGRRILIDPTLSGISVVVLDEFHERHLAMDVTLALLRRLQHGSRPDLKVCVMSATLDGEPIATYLGGCSRIRSEGRRFEVRVEHAPMPDERPLTAQVTTAVRRILREEPTGDILVFLPGAAEIRRCEQALASVVQASGLLVMPLHGDLPLEAQARVVAPAAKRKIILSTNVAETSVTIDGVVAVIDSGLARIAGHSTWTGLSTLSLSKISQASAIQRAGRAGRTRPGVAIRLYTRHDFDSRRAHDVPEIARQDLAEVVLTLKALGILDTEDLEWLTPPPRASLTTAESILSRLAAVDDTGALTLLGRRMLRFPVHPRLARLLVEGEDRGVAGDAATLVSLIGERDIRERVGPVDDGQMPGGGHRRSAGADTGIDVIALLDLFEQARAARFAPDRLRGLGLDPRSTAMAEQARRQLAALVRTTHSRRDSAAQDRNARDQSLCRAALTAFFDRVARRRSAGDRTLLLASGGVAEVAYEPDSELIVAIDVEERTSHRGSGVIPGGSPGRAGTTVVRLGCGIDPDWLADLQGGDLQTSDVVEFDATTELVVRRSRLTFGALVLDETVRPADHSPQVSQILADAALARGAAEFDEPGVLSGLTSRLALLGKLYPDISFQVLDDARLREGLVAACEGLRGFAELREAGLTARLTSTLPPAVRARLASDTPTGITLPGGRVVRVNYQPDQPPWIESRIQDFFGMAQGPAIAGGRAPLTLHLLAPNGRAVQVTRDLESFWRQHYPAIRRELGRRYPRHSWPEDGRTATAPPPSQRRR